MPIAGQTILISGGSSGLGAASARSFAAQGANVIVVDVAPPSQPPEVEIAQRIHFSEADVTSDAAVRKALDEGERQFGPLTGAILCAGVAHGERVLSRNGPASLDAFRQVIEVNLIGTFNVARLAAEAIARGNADADGSRGVIVMTASVAAFEGQVGQSAYSASKGGIAAMTLPMSRELARHGIRVVTIAPGVFATPLMQSLPEAVQTSLLDQTLLPARFGRPEEFASLALHVFENHMLNGCIIRLDGAIRLAPR